jgi:hypothetical protein
MATFKAFMAEKDAAEGTIEEGLFGFGAKPMPVDQVLASVQAATRGVPQNPQSLSHILQGLTQANPAMKTALSAPGVLQQIHSQFATVGKTTPQSGEQDLDHMWGSTMQPGYGGKRQF